MKPHKKVYVLIGELEAEHAAVSYREAVAVSYSEETLNKYKDHMEKHNLYPNATLFDDYMIEEVPFLEEEDAASDAFSILPTDDGMTLMELVHIFSSVTSSEARRLIAQRAVKVDGIVFDHPKTHISLEKPIKLEVGKYDEITVGRLHEGGSGVE